MPNDLSEKFTQKPMAPAPMFLNQPERNIQKHYNDEIIEKIIGQEIIYYPIDVVNTNYHPLYKEAINKVFLPAIRVFLLIEHTDNETTTTNYGIDRRTKAKFHFHKKRLVIDQEINVREGDFIYWNKEYHEIVKLEESTLLWGNQNERTEIAASCIKARKGTFKE